MNEEKVKTSKRRYELIDIDKLIPYENNARTHSEEQVEKIANSIQEIATDCYRDFGTDGKYILDLEKNKITICQSHATTNQFAFPENIKATVNPLGYWTGGIDVDSGATNRKLGSDMGDAVTGGGLHGKDLSKADVTVNIYAFLCAQECGHAVEFSCSIGDDNINGKPYSEIVEIARRYIKDVGGFEKFAEWGLIR